MINQFTVTVFDVEMQRWFGFEILLNHVKLWVFGHLRDTDHRKLTISRVLINHQTRADPSMALRFMRRCCAGSKSNYP